MAISRPTLSDDIRRFFDAEFANEDAMRREARTKGGDDMDPSDDRFVPEAHLDSAYDSWRQMPDYIAAEYLGIAHLPAAEREQRLTQVEADLVALIERYSGGMSLRSLLAA